MVLPEQMVLDACYVQFGVPTVWTTAGGALSILTLIPIDPAAGADFGGGFDARPQETPARSVALRAFELAAAGLMITDPVSRALTPDWSGAKIQCDGVDRKILKKPLPLDTLRLEWRFDLA